MNARGKKRYRVGIDFTTLDGLTIGNGQYRYVVELVRGLAQAGTDWQFVLFGSKSQPVSELRDIAGPGLPVEYRAVRRCRLKGAYYLDHLRYSLIATLERLDVWHALHSFVPALLTCRTVVTEYDLMMEMFPEYKAATFSRPYRFYYSSLRERVDEIICISETTRADLLRLKKISPSRARTVLLGTHLNAGVDHAARDVFFARYPELCANPWIASPFNLEPRKNLDGLLRAFSRVASSSPRVRLLLFGRAALTEEREATFRNLVSSLGISDRIVLTGHVADEALRCIYAHCTLFVFPSLYEGFGLPVLEAMAQGACTVARKASAMRELIGDAGALVETTDVEMFASQIAELLLNPSRRSQLSEAARLRAKAFSTERMAAQTLEVYHHALATKVRAKNMPAGALG